MATRIPLFPLGTVLFPGGRIPLKIFETRYVDMISRSMRESAPFGIVGIINGREIGLTPEFHRVGTTATIESWDQGDDGLIFVVLKCSIISLTPPPPSSPSPQPPPLPSCFPACGRTGGHTVLAPADTGSARAHHGDHGCQ